MKQSGVNKYAWAKACARADTSVTAKAVGLCLLNYSTARGTNAHPGHARIAQELRVSEKTVSRGIAALIDAGLIRQIGEGRQASRRNWASVYRLTMPPQIDETETLDEPPEEPPEETAEPLATPSRPSREDCGPQDIRDRPADISGRPEDTSVHLSNLVTSNPLTSVPMPLPRDHAPGATDAADQAPAVEDGVCLAQGTQIDDPLPEYAVALQAFLTLGCDKMGFDNWCALSTHIEAECGWLDMDESRQVDGMLQDGRHPKAIVNKIRKDRGR